MTDELSLDDRKKAEALVAAGRFESISDVLHAGINALEEDDEWQDYARDRVATGLKDLEAGRTKSAEDVLAMMRTFNHD